MRSRTNQIIICLSDEELAASTRWPPGYGVPVSGSSGSVSAGLSSGRLLPVDVPQLIYEVRRIGNSLNQLLRIANSLGLLDAPQLRRELEVYIVDTYTKD